MTTSSNNNPTTNDGLSLLQSAMTSWSNFNLPGRRPQLESTASSLLESKEQSLVARKQLGEFTKNLKRALKVAEEEFQSTATMVTLATETKSTIKHYQSEIDALTRRCKLAETSFLQLYQSLYECCCFEEDAATDLTIVFQQSIQLLQSKEEQLHNLLRGMEELNDELEMGNAEQSRLKGELKEMERQLKEAIKKQGGGDKSSSGVSGGSEGGGGGSGSSALSLAEREELIRLRREVAEYEVEFRGLKNQDITIRKLESKIEELEQNREEEIQKELKKAQEELAESEGRRATEALEREASTSRKLESVELQLRAERAGREASANQLLNAENGLGEREAAWEAQRQILVQDADRLREELSEVGRERDAYRMKIEATGRSTSPIISSGNAPPSSGAAVGAKLAEYMSERKAYEAEISELSVTCNALREELRVKDDAMSEERRSLRMSIDALERERSFLANQISALEIKVASAPSQDAVDKMRHELRILKRLEYNAIDFDHRDHDPEMTHPDNIMGKEDDLESVLVAKLRKVEADLVRERREKGEGNKERDELNQKLITVQKSLIDAEALVASLENDLQRAVATPTKPVNNRPALSDVPLGSTPNPNTLQRILDPNAPPIISNPLPVPPSATATAEKAHDDHSVATIVMAQRDRLRARCDALEAERDSFKRELQVQVEAAESMKTDNTKLYEKVRYLQSFNGGGYSKGGSGGFLRGGSSRAGSERDLDLEALEQRYEASVDPFRQFSRAERQRKFNEMSPMEKIVYIVAKTTLGSKEMRTALFFYVLAMHLLVFVTTYHWSHSSTCGSFHNHEALAHFHGGIPLENSPNASVEFANSSIGTD